MMIFMARAMLPTKLECSGEDIIIELDSRLNLCSVAANLFREALSFIACLAVGKTAKNKK